MVFADSSNALTLNLATTVGVAVIVGLGTWINGRNNQWKSNYEAERVEKDRLLAELNELKLQNSKLANLPNLEKLYEINQEILQAIQSLAKSTQSVAKSTKSIAEK